MQNSSIFYTKKRINTRLKYINLRRKIFGVDTTKILVNKISEDIRTGYKILDIGTGTGHLIDLVLKKTRKQVHITGCDTSKEMIETARKKIIDKRANFIVADNNKLPYGKSEFDMVIGKLVTNFSAKEMFRVLKKNGIFFYKEYGKYKGMKELFELFPKRIKSHHTSEYIEKLREAGFESINVNHYFFKRKYSEVEFKQILEMAPIIKNYSKNDWNKVKKAFFSKDKFCTIGSDPFILIATKQVHE